MRNLSKNRPLFAFLVKLAVVCLIIWVIFTFFFGFTRMSGETMYPRVRDGDLLLYYRLDSDYYTGDVVTFKVDGYRRVARIVGRGNDTIEVDEDGQLLVNGNVQSEEIFYPTYAAAGGVTYPYTVPEDAYFVLCDFRTASSDSRDYGAVAKKDIDGRVMTILRRRGI